MQFSNAKSQDLTELGTSLVVNSALSMQGAWVQSLGWEDPLEKEMAIHSNTIAWKIYGQRSLIGYSPWGHKESDTTEQLHCHCHCRLMIWRNLLSVVLFGWFPRRGKEDVDQFTFPMGPFLKKLAKISW